MTRNDHRVRLRGYDTVDTEVLWEILSRDFPDLVERIEKHVTE